MAFRESFIGLCTYVTKVEIIKIDILLLQYIYTINWIFEFGLLYKSLNLEYFQTARNLHCFVIIDRLNSKNSFASYHLRLGTYGIFRYGTCFPVFHFTKNTELYLSSILCCLNNCYPDVWTFTQTKSKIIFFELNAI